jgi:hypothetical protein
VSIHPDAARRFKTEAEALAFDERVSGRAAAPGCWASATAPPR